MQLCAVVMGTTYGSRLVADAKAQIETRGVDDSLVEGLQTSFAPLRELTDKGVACDRSEKNLKEWFLDIVWCFSVFLSEQFLVQTSNLIFFLFF